MEETRVITGTTEQEVWNLLERDLTAEDGLLSYQANIRQADREIQIYIDIDPGGGFEGGYELTQLTAPVHIKADFKFAIHDEGFVDEIGKFFGMEDIEIGFPELDKHVVIRSNHEATIRTIFADAEVRQVFTELDDFDFGIHTHSDSQYPVLELNIDEGVIDPVALRRIYHAFYTVLTKIEE